MSLISYQEDEQWKRQGTETRVEGMYRVLVECMYVKYVFEFALDAQVVQRSSDKHDREKKQRYREEIGGCRIGVFHPSFNTYSSSRRRPSRSP